MLAENIQRFKQLFFIQTNYYPEMWKSRKTGLTGYSPACVKKHSADCKRHNYRCEECTARQLKPLTDEMIQRHFEGKATLGAYQLYDDMVLWLLLDFDAQKPEAKSSALEMARLAWAQLDHLAVPAYLEDSGNKGYHLWVFLSAPAKAALLQELGLRLLNKIRQDSEFAHVEVEVFPKQTKLVNGDFGNLVKLPLGIHQKTGRRCEFIRPDGAQIEDQQAFLLSIETFNPNELQAVIDEFEVVALQRQISETHIPDIIPEGKRDKTMASIAGAMRAKGMTAEEIEIALTAVNRNRCRPPLDEKSIARIARSIGRYPTRMTLADETESYYSIQDNRIVYVKPKPIYVKGQGIMQEWQTQPVCNFTVSIAAELASCDGDETESMFSIYGQTSDRSFQFDISAEDAADQRKLQAALLIHGGGRAVVYAGQMRHVLPAMQILSNGNYSRQIRYISTGWQRLSDGWIFVTPGGGIGVDQARCDVDSALKNYRVTANDADLPHGIEALMCLLEAFDHAISYPAIAHAFLAPLLRFLPNVKRYCLHLTGETGSLKTTYATLLLCLFGDFGNEDPTAKFGGTINSIEALGHQAKDVLFVVDDFKPRYVRLEEITRLVQNYSDGHGRSRLNRDASLKATKYIRGALLTTGEDVPEHEASVIARMLIVKMSRFDGKNERLARAAELAASLPVVMGSFVSWLMQNGASELESLVMKKRDYFLSALSDQNITNAGRIATNAAQNWTAFYYFTRWAHECACWSEAQAEYSLAEHESILMSLCHDMSQRISEEKASMTFIEAIRAMIASGEAVIIDRLKPEVDASGDHLLNKDEPVGKLLLGWKDDDGIYMQASTAYHAVEKWYRQVGQSIGFSAKALFDQLEADGLIVSRTTVKKTSHGQVRVVHFKNNLLVDEVDDELPF